MLVCERVHSLPNIERKSYLYFLGSLFFHGPVIHLLQVLVKGHHRTANPYLKVRGMRGARLQYENQA